MRNCKACNKTIGFLERSNYCQECRKHLSPRERLLEQGWNDKPFTTNYGDANK